MYLFAINNQCFNGLPAACIGHAEWTALQRECLVLTHKVREILAFSGLLCTTSRLLMNKKIPFQHIYEANSQLTRIYTT